MQLCNYVTMQFKLTGGHMVLKKPAIYDLRFTIGRRPKGIEESKIYGALFA